MTREGGRDVLSPMSCSAPDMDQMKGDCAMATILSEVTKRVNAALLADERTADYSIEAVDENGVVTITGTVPSAEVQEAAESITAEQEGVVEVINRIEVGEAPEREGGTPPPPPRAPQR